MSLRSRVEQKHILTREDGVEYTVSGCCSIVTRQNTNTIILLVDAEDDAWIYAPAALANNILAEGLDESDAQLREDPITIVFDRRTSKAGREYINYTVVD